MALRWKSSNAPSSTVAPFHRTNVGQQLGAGGSPLFPPRSKRRSNGHAQELASNRDGEWSQLLVCNKKDGAVVAVARVMLSNIRLRADGVRHALARQETPAHARRGSTRRYKDMMIFRNQHGRSLQMLSEWKGPRPQVPGFRVRRLWHPELAGHGSYAYLPRKQWSMAPWGRREPRFRVDQSVGPEMASSRSSCSSYTGKGNLLAGPAQKGLAVVPAVNRPLSNLALQPSPGAVGVLAQVVA